MIKKEIEKCEKCEDVAKEIEGLWKSKVLLKVVLVVGGVLVGHATESEGLLEEIGNPRQENND